MAFDEDLANRIRDIVQDERGPDREADVRRARVPYQRQHAVSASGQGRVLLRVDPADTPNLVQRPEASRFEMHGREMHGWLRIDATGLDTKRQLESWVSRGVRYARSLPPK